MPSINPKPVTGAETPLYSKSDKKSRAFSSAEKVKIAVATFFASIFGSPLIGILVFLVMYNHYDSQKQDPQKNTLELSRVTKECKIPRPSNGDWSKIKNIIGKEIETTKVPSKEDGFFKPEGSVSDSTCFHKADKMTFTTFLEVDPSLGKKAFKIAFKGLDGNVYSLKQSDMKEPLGVIMKELTDNGYKFVPSRGGNV